MLLEVLVAIVIASLALSVLGRAMASGWRSTRTPLDMLSAVTLARADLQRAANGQIAQAEAPAGFSLVRRTAPVHLVERPSRLAPPPAAAPTVSATAARGPVANDVMPGVTHHLGTAGGAGSGQLQRITVSIRTPTGRRVSFETIRLDAAPN